MENYIPNLKQWKKQRSLEEKAKLLERHEKLVINSFERLPWYKKVMIYAAYIKNKVLPRIISNLKMRYIAIRIKYFK